MLSLASRGWTEVGIGVLHRGARSSLELSRGLGPSAASTHPGLSPQPGKLTEAFKYFLQGMGYSECQGWARGWCVAACAHCVCVPACACADPAAGEEPGTPACSTWWRAVPATVVVYGQVHTIPIPAFIGAWGVQAPREHRGVYKASVCVRTGSLCTSLSGPVCAYRPMSTCWGAVCVCTCVCTRVKVRVRMCVCLHVHACRHMCLCVCVQVCVHEHVGAGQGLLALRSGQNG